MPEMSRHEYVRSQALSKESFYALLMAAMRKADSANAEKLDAAFPGVWAELQARYNAPGGLLEGEE
tara:strand:- start:5562 stop:5759 length:198 start_codon:yes stop_codon:yes gene_type:complete